MLLISGQGPGYPKIWHAADMPIEERLKLHVRGHYEPVRPLEAGEYVTITFHFEVGEEKIAGGGRLGIAWRWPFDWGDLQSEDPKGDGYMAVSTAASEVDIEATYHRKGGVDPWPHYISLEVIRGYLARGDRVCLVCGDRTGGSRGWRAPTFMTKSAGFLMVIDRDGSGRWVRPPDPPSFPVVSAPPVRLVVICPSHAVVGEAVDVLVRGLDRWGNPTSVSKGIPQLSAQQQTRSDENVVSVLGDAAVSCDPAVYRFRVQFNRAGRYRLFASVPDTDLSAESNPVWVYAQRPSLRLFWGDLHSGQAEIGCGAGTLVEHYTYARDVAGLQFVTHQANDHYVTRDDWQRVRKEATAFNEPGRFVTFLGCEWSPPTENGGDRNVIYRRDEPKLRRSGRYFRESDPDPEPDIPTAPVSTKPLWEKTCSSTFTWGVGPPI